MPLCVHCSKQFKRDKYLKEHLRNIHGVEQVNSKKIRRLKCFDCDNLFSSYAEIREHLASAHNQQTFKETFHFSRQEDFLSWKEEKEHQMKCSYVLQTGIKKTGGKKKSYYICHRSATSQLEEKVTSDIKKKKVKSQGLVKLSCVCPSTLELVEANGKYEATLFTPHMGHLCSLKHINLSKTERKQIAERISEGVSFERILEDVRDSLVSVESRERIHLLNRQDLRNIKKEFSLEKSSKLTQNDSTTDQGALCVFVSDHNNKVQVDMSGNQKIQLQLDMLYNYCANSLFEQEIQVRIEKMLSDVITLVQKNVNLEILTPTTSEPANKIVEKQLRFTSTKRKQAISKIVKKPRSDHCYVKRNIFNCEIKKLSV